MYVYMHKYNKYNMYILQYRPNELKRMLSRLEHLGKPS